MTREQLDRYEELCSPHRSPTADLEEKWERYRRAPCHVDGHAQALEVVVAELVLVARAQSARIAELESLLNR